MNGGRLHDAIMVNALREAAKEVGKRVWTEFPVRTSRVVGFVDLLIELDSGFISFEVELTPARIPADIIKARLLGARLFIVVPTYPVVQSCKRRIKRLGLRENQDLKIVTLGGALKFLRRF